MNERVGDWPGLATAGQTPSVAATSATGAASGLHSMSVPGSGREAQPPPFEPQRNGQQQQQQQQGVVSASDTAPPPAKKRRRSEAAPEGCNMCRLRKVKCSGRLKENISGRCGQCERLGFQCGFSSEQGRPSRVTPSRDRTEAGTVRKRAQKACQECHTHKTKCSGDSPRCKRCEEHNLRCEYVATTRKFSHAPGPLSDTRGDSQDVAAGPSFGAARDNGTPLPSPIGPAISPAMTPQTRRSSIGSLYGEDLLAQKDTLVRHFQVFFSLWAPMPCMGIMHPETTYAEIEERKLHPIVAAAICAITSRIVAPGQTQIPFAEQCADQVDFYLFRTMNSFLRKTAHENLIVLVCAICHFWHENQMGKVWMYMGLAARLITALQLNWDGAGDTLVKQEMNRRLVWACYILDRLLAGGFDEHLVLRDNDMHLKLPVSNEVLYETIKYEATKAADISRQDATACGPNIKPSNPAKLCLDGYHLRLHRLRHQILGVTKRLTSPPLLHPRRQQMEASQVIKLVNHLQNQLLHFKQTLSEEFTLTDANINHFLSSPEGPSFIMLHSLFWILHIDLYRFTIRGIREEANPELLEKLPDEFVYKSQRQVVGYAVSLARFWRNLQGIVARRPPGNGTEKLLTVDQMFAIYVVQPTRMLLIARQRRLFDNLDSSTAPLVRQEPVDDAALAALVQSNMQLISPFARFFPRILVITKDLRHEVDNFSLDTQNGHVCTMSTPATRPSENHRLPCPHDLLEHVLEPEETKKDDRAKYQSLADLWFQHKRMSIEQSAALMTPPMARPADEAAVAPLPVSAPEIPIWLAEARGCDPLPETPPQDNSPVSPADAQACLSTQAGVGLGLTGAYLCEDAWSMPPPPQPAYTVYGVSNQPALLYERATGSTTAAIIPAMHASNGEAAHSRRNYNGANDTQISPLYSQQLDYG